jgi:hypothetical protein
MIDLILETVIMRFKNTILKHIEKFNINSMLKHIEKFYINSMLKHIQKLISICVF